MKVKNYEDVGQALISISESGKCLNTTIRDMSRILTRLWDGHRLLPKYISTEVLIGRNGVYAEFKEEGYLRQVALELYDDGTGIVMIMKEGELEESVDLPGDDKERIACQMIMKILCS